MKVDTKLDRIILTRLGFLLTVVFLASAPTEACTIFVLTDSNRVLFCNNEDWSDFKTRIWFVPGKPGTNGCAFVGFSDGVAQGGLNTEGLAFDWVAGYHEKLEPDARKKKLKGVSSTRMLQSCATVEEAIAFYQTYEERAFSMGRILVADRTGASVIIRAKDGHVDFDQTGRCRGFGYGQQALSKLLATNTPPTLTNAIKVLQAARQEGQYATKYSNVYDLKTGDVFLFPIPGRTDMVTLYLDEELKKGEHFYDMPKINGQLTRSQQGSGDNPKDDR